ncbi:hypothetical protein ASS88_01450 [Staphylococcus saprophyticus]|nr:hypothetical protein ASS88_01450 [Staphylococcus saprophyticus]
MRANSMKDYIVFYLEGESGPYPGMGGQKEVYKSWAEVYEPSQKDVQLGNLETSTVNVTVIIRNSFPEFVPDVNNTFTIETGLYEGTEFSIKNVAPKEQNTMKIVGSKLWD